MTVMMKLHIMIISSLLSINDDNDNDNEMSGIQTHAA